MQQNDGNLKPLIDDVLDYGDLLLIANKGQGKTNSLKVLASELRKLPNTRVIIFETFPKFALEFESIPYMRIRDGDVTESSHTIDLEDYFLRHEKDYSVLRGQEIKKALKKNKALIFTLEIRDIERIAFFVYSVVNHFYRRNYLRLYKNYDKTERVIFVVEESQNIFDSSTISKKLFNRMRKIFSESRNLDLHFVMCSQRLQDLNTKIRGRTRLMLGNVSLDDYELKIRRLLRHSKFRKEILNFKKGQFLYVSNDSIVNFPLFQTVGNPYELIAKPKKPQKKKGLWARLLNPEVKPNPYIIDKSKQNQDDLGEKDEELDEDILFLDDF